MEEDINLNSSRLESDKWVGRAALTSRSKVRQCRKRNSGTTSRVEAEKKIEKSAPILCLNHAAPASVLFLIDDHYGGQFLGGLE